MRVDRVVAQEVLDRLQPLGRPPYSSFHWHCRQSGVGSSRTQPRKYSPHGGRGSKPPIFSNRVGGCRERRAFGHPRASRACLAGRRRTSQRILGSSVRDRACGRPAPSTRSGVCRDPARSSGRGHFLARTTAGPDGSNEVRRISGTQARCRPERVDRDPSQYGRRRSSRSRRRRSDGVRRAALSGAWPRSDR